MHIKGKEKPQEDSININVNSNVSEFYLFCLEENASVVGSDCGIVWWCWATASWALL